MTESESIRAGAAAVAGMEPPAGQDEGGRTTDRYNGMGAMDGRRQGQPGLSTFSHPSPGGHTVEKQARPVRSQVSMSHEGVRISPQVGISEKPAIGPHTEPYILVSYKVLGLIKALEESPAVDPEDDPEAAQLREEISHTARQLFYKTRELATQLVLGPQYR